MAASAPRDAAWAHDTSDEAVERDFAGSITGTEPSEDFMVLVEGSPVGFIQRCRLQDYAEYLDELAELVDVPPGALTIDYFLGDPEVLGRGLGTRMVRGFTDRCWQDHPDATAVVVAVTVVNRASWAALAAAGYRRIATGHLTPDNPVDDGQHHVYRIDRPQPDEHRRSPAATSSAGAVARSGCSARGTGPWHRIRGCGSVRRPR